MPGKKVGWSEDVVDNEPAALTEQDIQKLRVAELRDELAKRGLDIKGLKPALIKRLTSAIRTTHH